MNWKQFLRKRFSKTTVWIILFFIMLVAFIFIILDETCTFNVDRLIRIQPEPSLSQPEDDKKSSPKEDEIEALNSPTIVCLVNLHIRHTEYV